MLGGAFTPLVLCASFDLAYIEMTNFERGTGAQFIKSKSEMDTILSVCLISNKRSKDHTPRAPALSCNFLDLDGIGRRGLILQAAPDHDSPGKGLSAPEMKHFLEWGL